MLLTRANAQYDGLKHRENILLIQAILRGYFQLASIRTYTSVNFDLDSDVYNRVPASANNASMGIIRDPVNLRLLVVGVGMETYDGDTASMKQIPAIIAGWRHVMDAGRPPLQPYESAARSALAFCSPLTAGRTWREISLIGHSFSGAVMVQLEIILRNLYPDAGIQTWTYGAPKSLAVYQEQPRPGQYIVETRTHADPVPSIPPTFAESPMLALAVPVFSNIGQNMSHPVTPDYVSSDGVMTGTRENSVVPLIGRRLALEEWLIGSNVFGSSNHSLDTYSSYISSTASVGEHTLSGGGDWGRSGFHSVDTNERDTSAGASGGADEDYAIGVGAIATTPARSTLPRVTAAAQRRAFVQVLQEQGVATTADIRPAMVELQQHIRPVPNARFRSVTRFGVRMVYYGDELQWVVHGKRVQRKTVRDMNKYLVDMGML